jgi:hypothetical protein
VTGEYTLRARNVRRSLSDLEHGLGSTKRRLASFRSSLVLAGLSALLLIAARPAHAQTETVLYNYFETGYDGAYPYSGLTSDGAGNFYGTNYSGGCSAVYCLPPSPAGTVFKLSLNSYGGYDESTLYSFCSVQNCADGAGPMSNVILDSAGNLYGTTYYGGNGGQYGGGVVFELSPQGTNWSETVLYSFCAQANCADGTNPTGNLIFDKYGNLYGTAGNVFELSLSGGAWTEQVIFGGGYGGLTADAAGNLFGVAISEVFELSPSDGTWTSTALCPLDEPGAASGPPVFDSAGNLYGTISAGIGLSYPGSVYKLTKGKYGKWTRHILYTFDPNNGKDGLDPQVGLVLDAAGNIYGTTGFGFYNAGTVFELVPQPGNSNAYKEKNLWGFNFWDGAFPSGGLILDSAGNLYGTTSEGGLRFGDGEDGNGFGIAFELNPKPVPMFFLSSQSPSIYGETLILEAAPPFPPQTTTQPPTGTVTFTWGEGKSIGSAPVSDPYNGVALLTRSKLNVGFYPLTAVYSGDGTNPSAMSGVLNQVIVQATSSATLTSSPNPSQLGEAVTFTATITSPTVVPTGPVTFMAGNKVLGTAQLSSRKAKFTTSTLPASVTAVTATFYGDSNIAGSSATVTQSVQP